MNDDGLGPLLERGPHRAEVEELLQPKAMSRRKLRRFLRTAWCAYNADRIVAARKAELQDLSELPFSEVRDDEVVYRVHGIVHDQRGFGLSMRPQVRDAIVGFVEAFDGPNEGYVLEYGFGKNFGLPPERDVGRGRNIFDEVGTRTALRFALKRIVYVPLIPIAPLLARFTREIAYRELWKTLEDLRHLPRARELYRLTQLPEPVESEVGGQTDARFIWAMSEGMARGMRERAEANDWKIVHCVCGFAHEAQIVLALKGERPSV